MQIHRDRANTELYRAFLQCFISELQLTPHQQKQLCKSAWDDHLLHGDL